MKIKNNEDESASNNGEVNRRQTTMFSSNAETGQRQEYFLNRNNRIPRNQKQNLIKLKKAIIHSGYFPPPPVDFPINIKQLHNPSGVLNAKPIFLSPSHQISNVANGRG
jgi:hypothetical protein